MVPPVISQSVMVTFEAFEALLPELYAEYTPEFAELYRYVEYPAVYRKEQVIGHLRAARPDETEEQAKARGGRDIATLLESPFFDVWAQAAVAEILCALYERVVIGPTR